MYIYIYTSVVNNPGHWTEWSEWSQCEGVCGDGLRNKIRICDPMFPELGEGDCSGADTIEEICYLGNCAPSKYITDIIYKLHIPFNVLFLYLYLYYRYNLIQIYIIFNDFY